MITKSDNETLSAKHAGSALLCICLAFLLLVSLNVRAQSFDSASGSSPIGEVDLCELKRDCRFEVRGDVVLINSDGELLRETEPRYRIRITDDAEEILSATISDAGNVLAIAVQKVTSSRRAFGGMARPDDLDRSFRVALHNPRSGSLIKSFDFGSKAIRSMALSDDGQVLMTATQDTDRRGRHQLLAFNARSGATVLDRAVEDANDVVISASGFFLSGERLLLQSRSSQTGMAVYNSRDPFSIAEYQVECSDAISAILGTDPSLSVGVMEIEDEATNQGMALSDAISSGLSQGGVRLVERSRIREVLEEIQLSTTGLTESQVAVDVGRLGVANYLIFGRASRNERNISTSMRLVSVEQGQIEATCSMICRDCENQDLYEGFLKLAEHWSN